VTSALARQLLFQMKRIRDVEETIAERYPEGKMRCPTHLSIGQEGVAAAVGTVLERTDLAVSSHRAHAHYLAKGGDLLRMLAEIYGKATGCSRGKGGSMHLIDEEAGFMGSTSIVGGSVPIGVGLAYAAQVRRSGQVVCVFMGDAVAETGVFFESVNFAVLKRLPVLFVCENNLYSVYSPLHVRQPAGRRIHEMVAAMGLPSSHGDGNDAREVYAMTASGVAAIRVGGGPQFFEFATYRWREHCGPRYDNDLGYRTEAEFLEWKEKDPIRRLEQALLAQGLLSVGEIEAMQTDIRREVDLAFEFAERSPFPPASDYLTGLYAGAAD